MGEVFDTVWKIAGTLGLVSVVAAAIRGRLMQWWRRRSSVRHPILTRRLAELRVGQTLDAFSEHLGEKPQSSGRDSAGLFYVFHCGNDASVVCTVDDDQTVRSFAVCVDAHDFHPTVNLTPRSEPALIVTLGVTTFADLGLPTALAGSLGAKNYEYRELHYMGSPGGYLDYVLSHDTYSPIETPLQMINALHEIEFGDDDTARFTPHPALRHPLLAEARRVTPITRYAVVPAAGAIEWQTI